MTLFNQANAAVANIRKFGIQFFGYVVLGCSRHSTLIEVTVVGVEFESPRPTPILVWNLSRPPLHQFYWASQLHRARYGNLLRPVDRSGSHQFISQTRYRSLNHARYRLAEIALAVRRDTEAEEQFRREQTIAELPER